MSHSHIDDLSLSLLHLPLASRNTSTHELSSTSSPSDSSHIPHPQLTQPSGIPSIPPPTAPTLLTSLSHLFSLACTLPDHLPFHTGTYEAMLPPLTVAFAEDVVEIKHEGVTSYAIVTVSPSAAHEGILEVQVLGRESGELMGLLREIEVLGR
jgi:hypothetical protein